VAASPGSYRRTVRVSKDESEFGKLRAGNVMAFPVAQPT
jgi:hypothetical protein